MQEGVIILLRPERFYLTLAVFIVSIWIFAGCHGKVLLYEEQLLAEADSLFRASNYEYAKVKYDKVRTLKPASPAARKAQYNLGYINVYYDNPFASWEAALREFKLFLSLYPDDPKVDEINSWIKILVSMQSFKKDYSGVSNRIEELQLKQIQAEQTLQSRQSSVNIEAITESLKNCYHTRDSLKERSKDLENFIIDLEKECQAAGK